MKEIYLDNAAATPTDPRVATAVLRAAALVGNPSAFNDAGRVAFQAAERARRTIARFLNARESEIVFCSSGSEANTLALIGTAQALGAVGHIITTAVEHRSVLEPVAILVKRGWKRTVVPVNERGIVDAEAIAKAITPRTKLVSVMYANNEVGALQPVAKIARLVGAWRRARRRPYPLLHIDACQASPYLDMDVQRLGADLVTFNGAKIYGPRGTAVLYVRRGVVIAPQVLGGGQERGRRAGTENVPGMVGLATALLSLRAADATRVRRLRDILLDRLPSITTGIRINGPLGDARLANNVNISVQDADSENLLLELDRYGIRAGSGSACTAHSVEPSHVLMAMRTPKRYLNGVVRLSLSRHTTLRGIERVLAVLPKAVAAARRRFLK